MSTEVTEAESLELSNAQAAHNEERAAVSVAERNFDVQEARVREAEKRFGDSNGDEDWLAVTEARAGRDRLELSLRRAKTREASARTLAGNVEQRIATRTLETMRPSTLPGFFDASLAPELSRLVIVHRELAAIRRDMMLRVEAHNRRGDAFVAVGRKLGRKLNFERVEALRFWFLAQRLAAVIGGLKTVEDLKHTIQSYQLLNAAIATSGVFGWDAESPATVQWLQALAGGAHVDASPPRVSISAEEWEVEQRMVAEEAAIVATALASVGAAE